MHQSGGSLPPLDLGAGRRPSRGGPALRNACFGGTFANRGTAADAGEKIAKCTLEIADRDSHSSKRSAGTRGRGRSHHTCCSQEDMHDAENSQRSPVALLPARDPRDPHWSAFIRTHSPACGGMMTRFETSLVNSCRMRFSVATGGTWHPTDRVRPQRLVCQRIGQGNSPIIAVTAIRGFRLRERSLGKATARKPAIGKVGSSTGRRVPAPGRSQTCSHSRLAR
jgi:hypothetical protein